MITHTSWIPALVLSLHMPSAACWGNVGHRTIAYLAQARLPPDIRAQLPHLTGLNDFSDAAIWADTIAKEPSHSYSASWHYINVHDDPPEYCNMSTTVNLTNSNILTALINQTEIIAYHQCSKIEQMEAFRYVAHLIGDLHQPLHVEGLGRGGIDVPVLFEARASNLHIVWDVDMIDKYRRQEGDTERERAKLWAQKLFERSNADLAKYKCNDINNALRCFVSWAEMSNSYVCRYVLHDGIANIKDKELSRTYYRQNIAVVEELIQAAGLRLADWLLLVLEARDGINHGLQAPRDNMPYADLRAVLAKTRRCTCEWLSARPFLGTGNGQ